MLAIDRNNIRTLLAVDRCLRVIVDRTRSCFFGRLIVADIVVVACSGEQFAVKDVVDCSGEW